MILILDNIRSAGNVGSIFRTADAFAVSLVCCCGITACPPHREILKTALGATETVPWTYFESSSDCIHYLRQQFPLKVIAVEQSETAISLSNFSLSSDQEYALVLGNEVEGVQQTILDLCDTAVEIPQLGQKKSLNVTIAAGIVMWHMVSLGQPKTSSV